MEGEIIRNDWIINVSMSLKDYKKFYIDFLNKLEKRINDKIFKEDLKKVINIDKKHYDKCISIDKMKTIINYYKGKEIITSNYNLIQIITLGNPEIIFMLCIEAVRNQVSMTIQIEDFCLGQNMLIVEMVNVILNEKKASFYLNLNNLLSDKDIIEVSSIAQKTICIGNSNQYNLLNSKIKNLEMYPYGLFELYADSDEFDDLKRKIYEYALSNGYEVEIYYNDGCNNSKEIIDLMKEDGYGFCSILLSKDVDIMEYFKQKINSRYIVVNENPFKYIDFELKLV